MGGACSAYEGREEAYASFCWGIPRERDHLGDPGADGRIILRRIFRKRDVGVWTGSSWLRIGTGGGYDIFSAVHFLTCSSNSETGGSFQHTPIHFYKICRNMFLTSKPNSLKLPHSFKGFPHRSYNDFLKGWVEFYVLLTVHLVGVMCHIVVLVSCVIL